MRLPPDARAAPVTPLAVPCRALVACLPPARATALFDHLLRRFADDEQRFSPLAGLIADFAGGGARPDAESLQTAWLRLMELVRRGERIPELSRVVAALALLQPPSVAVAAIMELVKLPPLAQAGADLFLIAALRPLVPELPEVAKIGFWASLRLIETRFAIEA